MTFQLDTTTKPVPQKRKLHDWEFIGKYMMRMAVPGGWLYSHDKAMCFVPVPSPEVSRSPNEQIWHRATNGCDQ